MKSSFISVIIPMRAISDVLLHENLPSFNEQRYKNFEVIILPNEMSEHDQTLLKKYRFLRIIPTKKIHRPALKRDIGAKHAKGDILAFIDDDAFAKKKWLKNAVEVFDKKQVGAVCGPGILPKNAQFWEQVFDEVLKTSVGSGGFAYRFVRRPARYVDDYPSMNFLIKKKLFKKLGGFNSDYWPGEDSKLCEDLVYKLGEKIYYDPSVTIYHHRRNNLIGYLKQHGNYGFHRGAFFAHGDRNSRRLTYVIPTVFVGYLFLLALLTIFNLKFLILNKFLIFNFSRIAGSSSAGKFLIIPLILYIIILLYTGMTALRNTKSLKIAIFSAIVLFLTHVIYGVQFIKGFFSGKIKKKNIYN